MSKEQFLEQFDQIPALFPIQGEARAVIHNGLDFPTSKDEQWKYTKVGPVVNATYAFHDSSSDSTKLDLSSSMDHLVFVNGVFQPQLSSIEIEGVQVTSMAQAQGDLKEQMLKRLGSFSNFKQQAFQALNTGYFKDGAYIKVAEKAVIERAICITNVTTGKAQANNTRNLIEVGQFAEVKFVQRCIGADNDGSFHNLVNEIGVAEGAKASLYLIQNEGDTSRTITATNATQGKNSQLSFFTLTKSGLLVRNNIWVGIAGEGCETNMYGLYYTRGKQHVDNQTYADHQKANCQSNELYKGVMDERSTGVFNGKIMVHREAQQTNAFQSNQNVLLSDTANINTKPELEIYADDVKCSHGCTIGQLDEEAMFYLRSRGLGRVAAHNLLVQAFAADVIDFIEIDEVKAEALNFIESRF